MGIKPLKIVYLTCVAIVTGMFFSGTGMTQSLGNPAVLKQRTWSIGMAAEYTRYVMEEHEYEITRGITKIDFSFFRNVDIALLIGMGNLHIQYPESKKLTRFLGSNSLAIRGSLKAVEEIPGLPGLKLFGEGGLLRQSPVAGVSSTSVSDPGDFRLKFHWYEYWGSAGLLFSINSFDIYSGYQGRINRQVESFSNDVFESGFLSNVIAGIDFNLPQQFIINVHFRSGNGSAVSIGISQTGLLSF